MREALIDGARSAGIILGKEEVADFQTYYEFLTEKNRVMNLTAISGETQTDYMHFLDSIMLLKCCDFKGAKVIDVGSGAGFPGIPMKICEPSIELTLLDSSGKRIAFLEEISKKIDGDDILCIKMRAEEASLKQEYRGRYDFAVARAVARLRVLCELCMPFVRTGGKFVAMKAENSDDETREALPAINLLGGKLEECREYTIPGTEIVRKAIIIKKISDTPAKYPRQNSKIKKAPL